MSNQVAEVLAMLIDNKHHLFWPQKVRRAKELLLQQCPHCQHIAPRETQWPDKRTCDACAEVYAVDQAAIEALD